MSTKRRPNAPCDRAKDKPLGALIVEQISDDFLDVPTQRRVETVREHGALALKNALEHDGLFLMPVWRAIGRTRAVVTWRNLPKILGALGIVLGIAIALFLVPAELTLDSRGTLEPVDQREIFADQAGIIIAIEPIQQGEHVAKDQKLAQMSSQELETDISAANGDMKIAQEMVQSANNSLRLSNITPVERIRFQGERAKFQSQINNLETKLEILEFRRSQLIVRSPIDGILTTWDARNKLINRPVERGQKLLSVADDKGEWQLELQMPEDRMGHILAARRELKKQKKDEDLAVTFILATQPGRELRGRIRDIHSIAEVQGEEGNIVLIKVAVDRKEFAAADIRDLRAGANVTAKVHCGKTSLGYAWFHDVIAFVQSRVLFKFW
ncbi:MAG: HlyD family efflux transporter periplasmic adaptor subunit [Pirellulales bacterium]